MALKVKEMFEVKKKFNFEAPVLETKIKSRNNVGQNHNEPSEQISDVKSIDLNLILAPNPKDLFIVQVSGESMVDENIFDGDLLIVSKSEIVKSGKIVIASVNGELVVKKLKIIDGKTYLFSANSKFLPIEILPFYSFYVQGVVKHVIHTV